MTTLYVKDAADGLGARLAFRCPQREIGKTAASTIPIMSDTHRDLAFETNVVSESSCRMTRKPDDRHKYPDTPDGRYFVVRGRLWRKSNPALSEDERDRLVKDLMSARRAVRDTQVGSAARAEARSQVDLAKIRLGERGPVWWSDGQPDYNRHMAKNTPYARWFASL